MQIAKTQQFFVSDPRTFDGNPFEVAQRAAEQAAGVARILAFCAQTAYIMARNAEMDRQIMAGQDPDPAAFESGPHGRRFQETVDAAHKAQKDLQTLSMAAGFDPKRPLNAGA